MILGLVEHDRGKLNPLSLEMLTFARRLAEQLAVPLEAVLIEPAAAPLAAGLAAYGVTTVHLASHPQLTDYAPEAWAQSVGELMAALQPAAVLVGGGRGGGSAEGFALLEELAGLLGGTVGCSRAVTSLGWRPHLDQVGQTGTRIAPEIYIACGISGAIQHMVGCKAAKHILAINI